MGGTDMDMFLDAAWAQEDELARAAGLRRSRSQATPEESQAAKKELNFIFGGDNAEQAEAMYRQGLSDVVHLRRKTVTRMVSFVFTDGFIAYSQKVTATGDWTDEARFYMYVEHLTATAAALYDKPSSYVNEGRFGRVDDPKDDLSTGKEVAYQHN